MSGLFYSSANKNITTPNPPFHLKSLDLSQLLLDSSCQCSGSCRKAGFPGKCRIQHVAAHADACSLVGTRKCDIRNAAGSSARQPCGTGVSLINLASCTYIAHSVAAISRGGAIIIDSALHHSRHHLASRRRRGCRGCRCKDIHGKCVTPAIATFPDLNFFRRALNTQVSISSASPGVIKG